MNNKIATRMLTELHPKARYQQYIYLPVIRCLSTFANKNGGHLAGAECVDIANAQSSPVIASTGHIDEGFVSSDDSAIVGGEFSTCRSTGENVELEGQT